MFEPAATFSVPPARILRPPVQGRAVPATPLPCLRSPSRQGPPADRGGRGRTSPSAFSEGPGGSSARRGCAFTRAFRRVSRWPNTVHRAAAV